MDRYVGWLLNFYWLWMLYLQENIGRELFCVDLDKLADTLVKYEGELFMLKYDNDRRGKWQMAVAGARTVNT